ncbi:MAG TPA: proline racemase family protein [Actinomycetota bacterium]
MEIATTDYHTAGEPFRIVTGGAPALEGPSILDKRAFAAERLDEVRQLLIHEPRGHADMYGCFVTDPEDEDADLGVVFFHNAGYSTACGHGTIALVTWALESGRLDPQGLEVEDGEVRVVVDVPSGRLPTWARLVGDRVRSVRFRNVPSFCGARGIEVAGVTADVSYGGAFYASVGAADAGLTVEPEHTEGFIALGREIQAALNERGIGEHPAEERLSGVYGVIFHEPAPEPEARVHQRNVAIFADGEVDRSPCGSGTSARLALLHADGGIGLGEWMLHDGIVGTRFRGRIVEETGIHGLPAVVTEVEGSAHRSGEHRFVLEEDDPLGTGFLLR